MKQILPIGILVTLAMVVAAPAQAQRIEFTPFVGYQFGGELDQVGELTTTLDITESPTWGLIFDIDITGLDQVEVYYSSQGTELDRGTASSPKVTIDTLQIGAIHQYAPNRPVNPYIGLTLGATRFDLEGGSDTRFSGGLAGGLKMIVSDHLGFRFDARVFGITTGSGDISCSEGLCIGYPDTSVIWQYTVNAGVIIHFGG